MSRGKELVKNTAILAIGKAGTQIVQFFLLPLYTSYLSREEYGLVDLFNTCVTLLVPLFNWQFEMGLFRFLLDCRADFDKQIRTFSTVLTANMLQILAYVSLYLLVQNYLTSEYKYFLLIDVVAGIIMNTLMQFSRGIGHNVVYAASGFVLTTTTVLLNIVLIAMVHLNAMGMFIAVSASKLVTIAYLFISLRMWKYISVGVCDWLLLKDIARYSVPLVTNALSWWVIAYSNRMVITSTLGVGANGVYSIATKFPGVFITFFNIVNMSWNETVSLHIQDEDSEEFLTDMLNKALGIFLSLCIGIVACLPFVFHLLVNEQYGAAIYQVPVLMVSAIFQVVAGFYSAIYLAEKNTVEITKTSVIAAVMNVTITLLLIRRFGLFAASIGTLSAYAVMAIYRYYHTKRYINLLISGKKLILAVLVYMLTIMSYYFGDAGTRVLVLCIVIVYALLTNWKIILIVNSIVLNGIKKKKEK